MSKAEKPHLAVLDIKLEVFDKLPSGECSGSPTPPDELANYGLKSRMIRSLKGGNRHDVLLKLKTLIDQLET